jgi:hygromycin-B 7''-O-kinase
MPKDHYPQPNAPDPVLAESVVLRLVRQFVPAAQAVTAVDESGGEARTYMVDDTIVLKTQRPHRLRPRTSLEREVFFLRHLEQFPIISVPRVLAYGQEAAIEYICMTRVPGDAVQRLSLTGAARTAMLLDLGRVLARIHQVPQEALVMSGQFPADRTAGDLHTRLTEAFEDVVASLERVDAGWALDRAPRTVAHTALAALPQTTAFVALHSNPGAEHTFADPPTQTYTGTIDFGDAYISHPALDLRRWKDPADREALLQGYLVEGPVDEAFMRVWRVSQIWADMAAIVATETYRDAAHAHLQRMLDALYH